MNFICIFFCTDKNPLQDFPQSKNQQRWMYLNSAGQCGAAQVQKWSLVLRKNAHHHNLVSLPLQHVKITPQTASESSWCFTLNCPLQYNCLKATPVYKDNRFLSQVAELLLSGFIFCHPCLLPVSTFFTFLSYLILLTSSCPLSHISNRVLATF